MLNANTIDKCQRPRESAGRRHNRSPAENALEVKMSTAQRKEKARSAWTKTRSEKSRIAQATHAECELHVTAT